MPLVWGTVLLSNVFSRAATPNSFRSRSSKADSARHRGTNYVIKDQQLQEIGRPKEPTCRGACACYLSGPYSPSCSLMVWQKCHGQLFSSVSFCLKVFPNGTWKQKSDGLTADPISLPQTALLSLSLMACLGLVCALSLLSWKATWKRNTRRREHLKNISEVHILGKIKLINAWNCYIYLNMPHH